MVYEKLLSEISQMHESKKILLSIDVDRYMSSYDPPSCFCAHKLNNILPNGK